MVVRIMMKSPDAVQDAIDRYVDESIPEGLSEDEAELIRDERIQDVKQKLERWVKYGEYIVCEFDTDAMTAVVVPQS